jgi:hypothetical protein
MLRQSLRQGLEKAAAGRWKRQGRSAALVIPIRRRDASAPSHRLRRQQPNGEP